MNISPAAIEVLKQSKIKGMELFLPLGLDRKTYVEVNKVLEIIGAKWNRGKQSHVFAEDPGDTVATCIAAGEIVDPKKEYQFFETPASVVERMVNLAELKPEHFILEPNAGRGAIIEGILKVQSQPKLYWCELNEKNFDFVAKKYGIQPFDIGRDFLAWKPKQSFDRILMNPPFTKGQDVDHVLHALSLLKPGGILVAITSPGWTFRTDTKHTAFRIMMGAYKADVKDLPAGTFKESGTMIATKLLVIKKSA